MRKVLARLALLKERKRESEKKSKKNCEVSDIYSVGKFGVAYAMEQ